MATYKFADLFDINDINKNIDALSKKFDKLNSDIIQGEKAYKGRGEKLIEESKRIEELTKREKELMDAERQRKKLESDIAKAQKLADKERDSAMKVRLKAEKEANKFLTQFNQTEQKSIELLRLKKKEISDNAKAEAQLETVLKKEVKTIDDLQKRNNALIAARKRVDLTTKQGKKQFNEYSKAIARNNNVLKKHDKSIGVFSRNVGNYTSAFQGLGKQLIGAAGIVGGVQLFVSALRNGMQIINNFSKAGSKLAAILGKSKDEIKGLTEQAKQLGSTTAFTASQVLEADTELAKLGFTTNQIQKSVPGILSLAAATGTELAPAAELAASTLRIFNLDASESGRVADVLAKSTTISSLSMDKLATIMPTVGKTAQLAGVSLERTAALAGTLTDRGLDASTAATSLRNIFLELSKKGLTWEQAMQKINSSTDKNKTAMDLFGKRAAAAGAILAETGTTTDELTKQLENSTGAAQEMANVMLDNLSGDMTKAQSAWEGFILSLESGEGTLSTIARNITQFFSGLLQALTNFNNEVAKLDDFSKKQLGLTEKQNKLLKEQNEQLKGITDKDKQRLKAIEIYSKLEKERAFLSKEALIASQKGDKRRLLAIQAELDIRLKLLENVKQYIPEFKKATQTTDENTTSTNNNANAVTKLTAAERKLIEQRKKEREAQQREQIRRTNIRLENLFIDQLGQNAGSVRNSTQAEIEAQRKKNQEIADQKKAIFEQNNADLLAMNKAFLDKQSNDNEEQAKKDAEMRLFVEEATQKTIQNFGELATQFLQQRNESELNAIQSKYDTENQLLQEQLDKGEITQDEYRRKKYENDRKARQEQAKAEKKAVLYNIGINTLLAIVSTLAKTGSFIASIKAGLIGAAQLALASAFPLPAFKSGKVKIDGPGTETSDSILARISKGESVIKASSTRKSSKLLNLINDDVLTDANASQILTKYNFSNDKYLKSVNENTSETNRILNKLGFSLQKKDGSYILMHADGTHTNISLNG